MVVSRAVRIAVTAEPDRPHPRGRRHQAQTQIPIDLDIGPFEHGSSVPRRKA
jgi:hypothetical protein